MSDRDARLHAAQRELSAAYVDGAEKRNAAILDHFKVGARRPWCRRVWESVVKLCGGRQRAAIDRLSVNGSTVSSGMSEGRLSIENLVLMLIEFQPAGWKLPDMPPHAEMAQEGFIEAMGFLRDPKQHPLARRRPTPEDLAALLALLADKEWFGLEAERGLASLSGDSHALQRLDERLDGAARRISRRASLRSNLAIERNRQQLQELLRTWADLWTECRCAIPFAWAERT